MLKKLLAAAMLLVPVAFTAPALAADQVADDNTLESIFIPFQGTWHDANHNSFIFLAGESRGDDGWVKGTVIGGGGQQNTYWWHDNGPVNGTLFFDTPQGRQGPIYVKLISASKMQWQFGTETVILDKI